MSNSMEIQKLRSKASHLGTRLALALSILAVPGMAVAQTARLPIYKVLHKFTGADGAVPRAGVIGDASGNLYGTTQLGGTGRCANCGTVYKIDAAGKETVLLSFGLTTTDGSDPDAGLVRDAAGNLYGTTATGGTTSKFGTIFKLDKNNKKTVLYTFTGGLDEAFPESVLLRDAAGNLFGTTFGRFDIGQSGTIFKLNPAGVMTVLHTFNDFDGLIPNDLVQDSAGNFFGTTDAGGAIEGGVVFELNAAGTFTIQHDFAGGTDGATPGSGTLLLDAAGNLYGSTYGGGTAQQGTVYKLAPTGAKTILHNFTGKADGGSPQGQGMVMDAAGNLYGTTSFGGNLKCQPPFGCGVIFRISPAGKMMVLHRFQGGVADGASPAQGLFQDAAGNIFGTTIFGGGGTAVGCSGLGCGTVFKLTP